MRVALTRSCVAAVAAALAACQPTPVTVHAQLAFSGAEEVDALRAALPPQLLQALGGEVPASWPDTAPPLLLTLQTFKRARLDFTGSGSLSPTQVAALRVLRLTAQVPPVIDFPLSPQPAELLVLAAPFEIGSPADPRAVPLARGAWPGSATQADGGMVTGPRELPLEAGGAGALEAILRAGNQVALFAVIKTPLDSRIDPHRPHGLAQLDLTLELELVP